MISTRDQFKDYVLRQLGHPVVDVNVDDDQVEDRIDDALQYYWDYHFDGTEHVLLPHALTSTDITNKYVTVPDTIIGVVGIFDVGDAVQTNNLFNIRYQIHLNDLFDFSSATFTPYVNAMRHIETLEEIFVGKKLIRFNRHTNRVYIDMDWEMLDAGRYIIIEGYRILDPDKYSEIWNDRWLKKYATALVKKNWGTNLKKFEGVQMPGGITLNGQKIYDEAVEEIEKMESEMLHSYSLPTYDMVG